MKHRKISWAALFIVSGILLATSTMAMDKHEEHNMTGDMAPMQDVQYGKAIMTLPGEQEIDGVKGMFHLMPIDPKALPAGHKATHHLMVMFNDTQSGKSIGGGTVAVKITDPDQKEAKPVKMMGMQGHFGVDVNLDRPGVWHFRIATKLDDGKVRQFHTHTVGK